MRRRGKTNVKRSAERKFVLSLGAMAVYAVVLFVVFLGLQSGCQTAARELKLAEEKLAEATRLRQHEEYKWGMLNTASSVAYALRGFGIDMSMPAPDRVVYLTRADHFDAPEAQGKQLAQSRRRDPGD